MLDTILNGVRTARMFIEWPIPAQAFIAGEFARFWYLSRPKTCRKCGAEDHLAATCKSQHCFNCEPPGHCAEQCDMPALCHVCLSDGHKTSSCPFVYYSSNVTGVKPADMSYSGAPRNRKLVDAARKAEEQTSRAKREEKERMRCEKRARKEKELERDRKKEQKEKERREKERKEKEREEKKRDDRRERQKRKSNQYHSRRHKDNDDYRRDKRGNRDWDGDCYCSFAIVPLIATVISARASLSLRVRDGPKYPIGKTKVRVSHVNLL